MKKSLFTFFLLTHLSVLFAQDGIGYYNDYSNNFYVFDKGIERQAEYGPVTDIRVGNNYISYRDSKLSFIYYYNGEKQVLEENTPNSVQATPTALVYKMQLRLMICENGEKKLLSKNADTYLASDSIVVWQEWPSMDYKAYENGKTNTVVKATNSESVIKDYKVGNNIMAFNDLNYNLKIYFKGKVYDTNSNRITSFECAHNTVAYIDEYNNTFNVFSDGAFKILSKEIIKQYYVSNDMVSFVDAKDNFYIFYDGTLTKIDTRSPDYFFAKADILCYSYNSELKIIYDGEIYTKSLVEKQSIKAGNNSLLFYINASQPTYFYKGKMIDNFYVQKPYTMNLRQDLPEFKYNNTVGFLYNGKIYEYAIRAK